VAAIAGWGRSARTHTHHHVLDILSRQRALNFTPGAEYSYSNSGYNLLAIIVDRVSGIPATSGYRAFLARYPEQQLDVALLCNVSSANPGALGRQVAGVFLGDAARPLTAARTASGTAGGATGTEAGRASLTAAQLTAYADRVR
jgi:hypothetical protein